MYVSPWQTWRSQEKVYHMIEYKSNIRACLRPDSSLVELCIGLVQTIILCSQLTSLSQNILVRRFARLTSGLISYKTNWQKQWPLLHEKRERSTDANLKTVRANFLTKLHRTWVWWTPTKKKKLYRFSVQNIETIVWKKIEEEKKRKKGKRKEEKREWKNEFVLHELTKAVLNAAFYKIACQVLGALI